MGGVNFGVVRRGRDIAVRQDYKLQIYWQELTLNRSIGELSLMRTGLRQKYKYSAKVNQELDLPKPMVAHSYHETRRIGAA